jgi:hypothetical protein
MHYITAKHWRMMEKVIVYLCSNADEGIIFDGRREFVEYGMVDASYGSCMKTGKSQAGYAFFLAGGAIIWQSKLQLIIALSTMEAEYMAATPATKSGIWLRGLLDELKFNFGERPTTIFCDNNAALSLIKDPVERQQARHIRIQYHIVRHAVAHNDIRFAYVKSNENWADIFTKALPYPAFSIQTAMLLNKWSGYTCDAADEAGSPKRRREEEAI